jgi:hypothetical protein
MEPCAAAAGEGDEAPDGRDELSPGPANGPHLPASSSSAVQLIAAIGLEPRNAHSGRHLEPLQDLSRSGVDPPQIALVTFQVPCQSSPSTQVTTRGCTSRTRGRLRAQLPCAAEPPRRHPGELARKTVGQAPQVVASATAKNPVDPFIDPEGYRAYIDTAEAEFRQGVVHQQQHGLSPWWKLRGYFISRAHCAVSVYCWNVTALPSRKRYT